MGLTSQTTISFPKALLERWNRIEPSWRFAIVLFTAVRLFYAAWSWAIFTVQPVAIQNLELSNEPIVTVFSVQNSQSFAYSRSVDGRVLTFQAATPSSIIDQQTGSLWDISTGTAMQGALRGSKLLPSPTPVSEIFPYHNATPYPNRWLAIWQRFDANWYTSIADTGYGSIKGDDHFPPLFPVLIRAFKPLFGNAFLAGLVICNLATLFAIQLLYMLFNGWGKTTSAAQATTFFLIYPTSFFLFSAYSEPLFLLTALLAFRGMKDRSWAWAGFWIFCAILTRLQGVALLPPMVYLMWREGSFLRKVAHWFALATSALGGLFYLFLRSKQVSDSALPFVEAEWHARLVPPWETYGYAIKTLLSGTFTFIDALNWFIATLFIVLLIVGWRKIPLEYSLYLAFSLLIILIRIVETQPLISMSRYSLTLFPSFFILGQAAENPWVKRLFLYTFIPLNLYLSAQFFLWGWVA